MQTSKYINRIDKLPDPIGQGFPDSSVSKESACNARDPASIPGSGRSAEKGTGYPLQYSWASLVAQLVKNPLAMQETWVEKIPWRRERLPTPIFWPGESHGLYSPWGRKELDMWVRWVRRSTHLIAAQDALSKFPCFLKFSSVQFLSRVRLFVTS